MSELALLGGEPIRKGELPSYPPRGLEELKEVIRVLEIPNGSLWTAVAQGKTHRELEEAFAQYCGRKRAVAVNTGGMALRIALRAAGLSPGDEVLFQVNTCHAESVEVIHAGGVPVWVDVHRETGGLSEESVRETLAQHDRVKAIIAIHTWGRPEDLDMVCNVARERSLVVIEDCCLALGAEWRRRKVGTIGDVGVFSFGFAKPLQAGEGGMIVTDDESFARECQVLRVRGGLWSITGEEDVRSLGWNGRISAFVSAIALAQLRRYPEVLAQMQSNARCLEEAVRACEGLKLYREDERITAQSYTQFGFRVVPEELGISRSLFCDALRAEGIPCHPGTFRPTYRYSFFTSGEWKRWVLRRDGLDALEANYARSYTNAERLFDHEAVNIPRNVLLHERDARAAAEAIEKVCAATAKLASFAAGNP